MTLIYQTDGIKVYRKFICNYECQVLVFDSGNVSIGVPMGDSKKDKKMFDELVYNNKDIYNGTEVKDVILKVRTFIRNYKHSLKAI